MANQLTPNNPLAQEIRELVKNARTSVAQQVNTQLLSTYWQIGRAIVEYEQQSQLRAEYGKQALKELSKELTKEFGKRLFSLQYSVYAALLSDLLNSTDSVC